MRKKNKTIEGNLSNNKELKQLIERFPNAKIDTQIPIQDKGYFHFLGFNTTQKGLAIELSVRRFCKEVGLWQSMTQSQKEPNKIGGFNSMIMIHNPHIEETKEEEEKDGRLTSAKKVKLSKMMEQGKGQDDEGLKDIAKNLNLSFNQVKQYISSF